MDGHFTTQAQFDEASEKVTAWEAIRDKVAEIQSLVRGMIVDGHISEQDAKTVNNTLSEWQSDSEGQIDMQDTEDALRTYEYGWSEGRFTKPAPFGRTGR